MMVGTQQGSQQDYGLAFRESVLDVRIIWFLLLGVLAFLAFTYRDVVTPYVRRPGVRPLVIGVLVLVASFFLMKWYDPLGDGKFGTFADAVTQTPQVAALARAFFGWLWLVGLIGVPVAIFVAIALRLRWLAWVGAAVAAVLGVLAVVAHNTAATFAGGGGHPHGAPPPVARLPVLGGGGVGGG